MRLSTDFFSLNISHNLSANVIARKSLLLDRYHNLLLTGKINENVASDDQPIFPIFDRETIKRYEKIEKNPAAHTSYLKSSGRKTKDFCCAAYV